MNRIILKCQFPGQSTATVLQLDEKAMPGETGPSFMITENGCFKGYMTRKDGVYQPLGNPYFTKPEFQVITQEIQPNL